MPCIKEILKDKIMLNSISIKDKTYILSVNRTFFVIILVDSNFFIYVCSEQLIDLLT